MLKSVHYAPFLQWSVQQQIVLFIRLLCSLPTTVCAAADSVVHQVALLPSYNSKATVSSLYSLFVPIYPNLFEFLLNLFEFCRVFEWKERVWECLGEALSCSLSCHHPTFGAAYILDWLVKY